MRNIISLFVRYSAFIVFFTLECFSFYFIVNYNKSQKEIWAHSANRFTGTINSYMQGIEDFFELQNRNDSLLLENAKLLETIINYRISSKNNSFQDFEIQDDNNTYQLIPSRICSKTINLRNNFMTLNKGSQDSIKIGMGVLTENGVAGIIGQVSKNFSTVLMLINSESRTSAKIKGKDYFGNLLWQSSNPRIMKLTDVPKHAEVNVGDTIVTSGYSISFPEDILIGTITNYNILDGSNSYDIDVKLAIDLSNTDYVYVVSNIQSKEKSILLEYNE